MPEGEADGASPTRLRLVRPAVAARGIGHGVSAVRRGVSKRNRRQTEVDRVVAAPHPSGSSWGALMALARSVALRLRTVLEMIKFAQRSLILLLS